mmetsp:Transcript_19691/g.49882  ORF Transcript_19691/g.49882 Transcript_19691/m.49882 type:complete len:225 (-) Transcript_19691:1825-2499(-)
MLVAFDLESVHRTPAILLLNLGMDDVPQKDVPETTVHNQDPHVVFFAEPLKFIHEHVKYSDVTGLEDNRDHRLADRRQGRRSALRNLLPLPLPLLLLRLRRPRRQLENLLPKLVHNLSLFLKLLLRLLFGLGLRLELFVDTQSRPAAVYLGVFPPILALRVIDPLFFLCLQGILTLLAFPPRRPPSTSCTLRLLLLFVRRSFQGFDKEMRLRLVLHLHSREFAA